MLLSRICLHGALDNDEHRINLNFECQLVQVTRKTPFGFILFKNPSKGHIKDLGGPDLAHGLHIYTRLLHITQMKSKIGYRVSKREQ